MVSGGQTLRPWSPEDFLRSYDRKRQTKENHCTDTRDTQMDFHTCTHTHAQEGAKSSILWTAKGFFKRQNKGQTLALIYHVIHRMRKCRDVCNTLVTFDSSCSSIQEQQNLCCLLALPSHTQNEN